MEELQPLDNCEIFRQIRNAFTCYHNQQKKLQTFVYFSGKCVLPLYFSIILTLLTALFLPLLGNEEGIKELSSAVLSVLQEHELVEHELGDEQIPKPLPGADLDKLRGTWMYIMLNSANGDTKSSHWIPQCVHLLNQLPVPMPQFVTISVALFSGMQEQLFEFLACGPHWLVSQYFDCYNETLSHVVSDKCEALSFVCGALSAVTKSICYPALVGDDCSSTSSLVVNSQRLMQRHLLNSEERLRALRPVGARRRYLGEALRQLLDVAIEAIEAIRTPPKLPDYYRLYALRPDSAYNNAVHQETTTAANNVVSNLQCYVGKVLNGVQCLLQQINIDTYMYWCKMPSNTLLFHLQGHFCNQAKQLLQLLETDEILEKHSIRPQLMSFASGAQSFEERLSALTLGELLGLLDGEMGVVSDKQLLAGLAELLKRSITFGNDECVETMAKHVRLMGFPHAELMLQHLAQVVQMKMEQAEELMEEEDEDDEQYDMYGELLRQVLQPIFQGCPTNEKLKFLELRDNLNLLSHFTFILEGYESRRVFFFNQLGSSVREFPQDQFLNMCYEQPAQTWLSLAELAMLHPTYAVLYAHVAVKYAIHAKHHVDYTVRRLMQNERLLSQRPFKGQLLHRLYETPVILSGMVYYNMRQLRLNLRVPAVPYTSEELRLCQDQYLSSLAEGIGKFTESANFRALISLVSMLLQLEQIERHVIYSSHCCLKQERVRFVQVKRSGAPWKKQHERLVLASSYMTMHAKLPCWRSSHWKLIEQLIRTMDMLRGTFASFVTTRMSLLDQIMNYYVKSIRQALIVRPGWLPHPPQYRDLST